MDFRWFFGNGPRNPGGDGFPRFGEEANNTDSDEFDSSDRFSFRFPDDFENRNENNMFQQIEDLFNTAFSLPFTSFNFSTPNNTREDPLEMMLKDPSSYDLHVDKSDKESPRMDTDIDELFAKRPMLNTKPQSIFSFQKFASSKTIRHPDGTIEEHHSTTDSDGNTVSKVRQTLGGKSYEVILHSDAEGIKEKQENLINLDESDLTKFKNDWEALRSGKSSFPHPENIPVAPVITSPPGDTNYSSIFKKFFGLK